MQKSFTGFTRVKPKSLQAVAKFLMKGTIKTNDQNQEAFDWEGANFTKAEVKTLMQESFSSFTDATPENLRAVAKFLIKEYGFTKAEVKTLMQDSFFLALPMPLQRVFWLCPIF